MANRVFLTAVGLLYVASATLVVRHLGENHRRSLREKRAILALASARRGTVRVAPEGPPVANLPSEHRPASRLLAPTVVTNEYGSVTPARVPVLDASSEAASRPDPPSTPRPYVSPVKLKPLVLTGLDKAPAAEEMQFGDALNELILINHPAVEEGSPQQKLILGAVQPLLDLRERKEVEVKLVVLDTDEVNAFSHLGGYVYVTRGLLNFAGTDEEFRFVVGHELAHLDLKHGQEQVATLSRDGTAEKVGTLQAMYHQVAAGYTEPQEFAADDWVLDRMTKLDHTTRECLMYLRKLRRLSEDLKFREGRKAPGTPAEATVQDIGNHIRSQAAAWKRLARLETRLNATPSRPGAVGPPSSGR